ncbi:MAG: FAD-dependent oxidoreductase, partial [Planctomycetota bacterium]
MGAFGAGPGQVDPLARVAVIGAGVSGLIAARTLLDHNLEVTVFDKGRRSGGRTSSRRSEAGYLDHGAQYFTVRDPRFALRVRSWELDGVVARWRGRLVTIGTQGIGACDDPKPRYVGVPSMRALSEHLSRDLEVRQSVRIASVVKDSEC